MFNINIILELFRQDKVLFFFSFFFILLYKFVWLKLKKYISTILTFQI